MVDHNVSILTLHVYILYLYYEAVKLNYEFPHISPFGDLITSTFDKTTLIEIFDVSHSKVCDRFGKTTLIEYVFHIIMFLFVHEQYIYLVLQKCN